jgi:hydrogenase maturation factor
MCVGSIAKLCGIRDDDGAQVGRLEDGCEVPLSFVPGATVGAYLLLHLGIPVEVLSADQAADALALRESDSQPGALT